MVKTKKPLRSRSLPAKKRVLGPVTAISTAPVAIGNSIRGSKPMVEQTADGCRVRGRDFAFEMGASVAAATGWTLVGGIPLTPCAMPATSLKSYCQMFAFFKFNSVAVHYITSSPTSQAGDVMFYYEKDRTGPMIDSTSTSFLPFVLSDENSILGPQWTNHTSLIRPDPEFKSTNYGINPDLNEETNGSLFVFSKTNAANSPGYIIFDYDITFKQHQANPRAGLLPIVRAQWTQTCIGQTAVAQTAGTTVLAPAFQGKTVAGTNAAAPTGNSVGDVYKFVADVTNSTVSGVNAAWTNVTSATLLQYQTPGSGVSYTIDDGFTFYGVWNYAGTALNLYLTLTEALTGTYPLLAGATSTNTYNLCVYASVVGTVAAPRNQVSY